MPPATPATKVSLRELADLAIGTPEVGAVNFTALHTLIVAMLKNLKLHDTVIDFQTLSPEGGRSLESLPPSSQSSLPRVPQSHPPKERRKTLSRSSAHTLESQVKELEGQVQDLTRQLKTVDSQMQIIGNHVQQITSVESDFEAPTVLEVKDLAVLDTEKARIRSTQVQKDIRKPVDLLHDVVKDVNILKEAYQKAQELKPQDVLQRIEELEKLIRERDDFLEYMGQKLTLVPSREEVTMVTWEELEKAITDGWKASQVGSETAVGVSKRKMQSSLTSDLISSGVSTKYASTDHIPDSAGGPGQALPGSSATGHLFEAIAIRDRSKGSFIPGREQHPRAHDEANTSRFYQPPVAQFRTESDPHRSRERFTSGYPRREMHTSPTQQELPWARDQPSGQGQVYLRPDHQELGLPGMDQLGPLYPGPIPPDVLPVSAGQLGTLPPQMDGQGLVPLSMDQHGVVPPSVPGRDHQGSGLPSADELSMVPLGPYQYSLVLPGTDQCSTEQPGMQDSDVRPHGTDQHGFVILGMDQQGLVPPAGDQQGPESSDIQQRGLSPAPVERRGLVSPGLIRVRADQQGFLQPHVEASGFIQPGTEQQDLIQPDRDHSALGQPGTYQPGLAQPGADQRGSAQPGKYPPGLVQPGKDQDSLVQPGVDQHGLVQPSAVQHGSPQPGVAQLDVAQQGADQRGSIHPEVGRYDLMQPGAYPPAWAQAGADSSRSVQPGIGQHSLVQPGMDQRVFVQPGAVRHGLVQPGQGQFGMGRPGMDQRALVQPGASQRGLAQPGAGQIGVVPPGTDQHGLAQPTIDQHGLAPPGADQGGLAPPGAEQRDLAPPGADQSGLAQPGAEQHGLVPPGVNQRDLAPPGTGQFGVLQPGIGQPGADPQGLVQPGTYMPGVAQPTAYPPGLAQLGVYPPGLVPPGAYQPSSFQSGVSPHGLVQPGAYPCSLVQPGMDQRGWRQPSSDQQGLTVQGTELWRFPPFQADLRSLRSPHPYPYPPSVVPPGQEQPGWFSPFLASQGLLSPHTNTQGLVPAEIRQQGLVRPGVDRQSPAPLSTDKGSVHPDQQYLVSPGPDQQSQTYPGAVQPGQVHPVWDHHGPGYPGYGGPGAMGADPRGQVALDPNRISNFAAQTEPDQDATRFRSRDSLSFLHQVSSEKSGTQSERHDSLEKLAPNFPIALETFRLMGELIGLYMELKESLKDLDEEKSGQTDAEKIQYLFTQMVKKILPPDLQEQMKTIKALAKEVHQEKAKVEKMQRILEGDGEQVAGKELKAGQLGLQLGLLRITITDIEKELADLRDSQEQGKAAMENSVAEASLYLQDQLDKLRMIIESMLASSSTLLSLSMTPHKPLTVLAPGQIHPEATCPACSLDLSHQVSTLVQRYEQLQEMVSNLAASRPSRKAKLQSQDEELLGHVQSAILQVQGDCEKLNITTSNLLEDHRQKQKDIDVLYQGLEKLEKNANREHLQMEIDVKADKSALASKVSRVEFDAATEQLNHMMQGLMAKLSGQERDWQKLLDKLLAEMDMKLDRLELDPVKQALEDRWKSLREQLKEHSPLYQADEAAAMRRQLLAHFHCLSCDRPLETPVTGQIIPVTPVGHPLPGHRSTRPYTVFELEQVRQQSRNLKLGSCFPRGDQSPMEQSVGHLRTMHSKMLLDIEKVQIHFGGSVKASSQMIRELRQAHCLSSPCFKRVPDSADYTYSTMSRRCGGSHTLTYPYRRNRLQHPSQGAYAPENQIAMKHDEVDILGLDGHIYKGRMDTRLPGILTKDREHPASGMMKYKAKQCRPRGNRQQPLSDNSQLPSWPQSAQMLAGNNSVSSRQRQDRPVSSAVDPLAQSDMAPPPSPNLQGSLPGELERNTDMLPPGEGLEEPTRGPRSTTGQ